MTTMKAVRIHSFGGPEVLVHEDAPMPILNDDDVLIRVLAAGVNPLDCKIREGYMREMTTLPLIPGWDVAGIIEEKGLDVRGLEIGDSVYALSSVFRPGAYAQYIAVNALDVALKPDSLDFHQAAAVPLAALTAWQSLFDLARLQAGQKILIHAAASGVGHFAVQFAKWAGAHVIATAFPHHHDLLRSIGAHELMDYASPGLENVVHDADVVFDALGGEFWERSWEFLLNSSLPDSACSITQPGEEEALDKVCAHVFVQPDAAQLDEIAVLIDSGHVRPVVERILPLAEAEQAHRLIQAGQTAGRIVLHVANG